MPISYKDPFDDPLYDPPKEDRDPKIGDPQGGPSADEIQAMIDEALSQGMGPEEIQALVKKMLDEQAGPDLSGYAQQGDIDTAIEAALAGQTGPDLSGYAQQGDIKSAIEAALAGQTGPDLSGYAEQGDIEKAIEAALAGQAGPDLSGYAQTGDIQEMIDAAFAGQEGPDLSGYAQTGDMDAAIAAAMQGFSIDDQLRDAMEVWGKDFMPNTDLSQYMTADVVQQMIDDGLANGMSAEAVLKMIEEYGGPMDPAEIQRMIADSQASLEALGGLTESQIQQMITEGLANGMSPEDIQAMIAEATGGVIDSATVQDMITEAQASLESLGGLTQEQIQTMITDALANGMTPEDIQTMIADATGGNLTPEEIQTLIAEAQASLESLGGLTEAEIQQMITEGLANGLTPEQIQQMIAEATGGALDEATIQQLIDAAIAASQTGETGIEGMSQEDIQALLDSGYMTADQINALMSESGYLGQEGVDSSVQAALDAALGEGGSISSAIAGAMQGAGGGGETETDPVDTGMNFTQPYTPGDFPTNPYGDVDPYQLMYGQFAGTTPYSGGATTGAETPTGLGTLNLGDPTQYNFDIPTTPGVDLYPSGIDPRYFEPVPEPEESYGPLLG